METVGAAMSKRQLSARVAGKLVVVGGAAMAELRVAVLSRWAFPQFRQHFSGDIGKDYAGWQRRHAEHLAGPRQTLRRVLFPD
jgi:hypothetical protein